ncbi:hypothetical protein XELAEV_18023777mg [Xenopus laevis]|uniref:Gypsy retrotransposon integrase-like protein 1 n=1 Tax=Xenopus laevis TaxID=8355 RepID=A0A974HPY6_XENLA|nr:hypothetical protein XELAEV_18023777mg [Xenopus laevis]
MQPLHRPPLAINAAVETELNKLLQEDIIEPIDSSPWVSNLVIAKKKKKMGKSSYVWTYVNKAIIPDCYPLPTTEDLISQCHGSKFFTKLDLRKGYLQIPLSWQARNLTAFITHQGPFQTQCHLGCVLLQAVSRKSWLMDYNLTLNETKCVFTQTEVDFPKDRAELASFLGFTNDYLRFVADYAEITTPLRALLKKDVHWEWTPACSQAVSTLRHRIASAPTLVHFSTNAPTFASCDASAVAIGAVLSQIQHGVEHPVALASRALSPAEQKYAAGEREWHHFLYGRKFTLRTDHQALTSLLSTSGSAHCPLCIHRLSDRLYQYNFEVCYRPGKFNQVADYLSRIILKSKATKTAQEEEDTLIMSNSLVFTVTPQDLVISSQNDPVIQEILNYLCGEWPSVSPGHFQSYYQVRTELSPWKDVCLVRGHRAVILTAPRPAVLRMAHEGHLGVVRTKQLCREAVWWPGIDNQIETLIRNCEPCLLSGKNLKKTAAPLQARPFFQAPWDTIQLDICREIIIAPQHQRRMVFTVGLPVEIITDNGPQFVSKEFPSIEGQKNGIKVHLHEGLLFSKALTTVVQHYRSAPHSATGESPAKLMKGSNLWLPLTHLRSQIKVTEPRDLRARVNTYHDSRTKAKTITLKVGQWVRIRKPSTRSKFDPILSDPIQIHSQLGPVTYKLQDGSTWHVSSLVPVSEPSQVRDTASNWHFWNDSPNVVAQPKTPENPSGNTPPPVEWATEICRSSARTSNLPRHLDDYVLYNVSRF